MRLAVITFALLAAPLAAHAGCYDVSKSQPEELSGALSYRIFAGPPGYEDVQKGDTPEPGYVLKLAHPICLTGDPDFTDPADMFDEVQLVERDGTAADMKAFDGRDVTVRLSDQMPAQTGHHHRPLVAWVDAISADKDITEEYGTAAATIRAFYMALAVGQGEMASSMVIKEKRAKGPFSANELSRFYGSMKEPVQLLGLDDEGAGKFRVRYKYATAKSACNGAATISTVTRDGSFFIKSIKAHDGC